MKNKIELHTIAIYNNKEYELQNLLNGLLEEINKKNNIINELKETIKELTDDSEDTTCYEITNTVKRLLLEELEENK